MVSGESSDLGTGYRVTHLVHRVIGYHIMSLFFSYMMLFSHLKNPLARLKALDHGGDGDTSASVSASAFATAPCVCVFACVGGGL